RKPLATAAPSMKSPATTRSSKRRDGDQSVKLLRVRLVLGARMLERRQLPAGGIDGHNPAKTVERYLETAGVIDLRHQADVGRRGCGWTTCTYSMMASA